MKTTQAQIALEDMYRDDSDRPYPIAVRREYKGRTKQVCRYSGQRISKLVIQHYADGSRLFIPKDARDPWAA